jgi:hypothetical protein
MVITFSLWKLHVVLSLLAFNKPDKSIDIGLSIMLM